MRTAAVWANVIALLALPAPLHAQPGSAPRAAAPDGARTRRPASLPERAAAPRAAPPTTRVPPSEALSEPVVRVARTAAQSRFVLEADLGTHGCVRSTCTDTKPHLATRVAFLFRLHRYVALGQQLALTFDRNDWYEEAPKIANRNVYTGVDFRVRIPCRRALFWGSLTLGYVNRRYLLVQDWANDRWQTYHGLAYGGGVGIDLFATPLLAIGVSTWILRDLAGSTYYSDARPSEDLDEGASIHWTVNAGVRIYLSRRAP